MRLVFFLFWMARCAQFEDEGVVHLIIDDDRDLPAAAGDVHDSGRLLVGNARLKGSEFWFWPGSFDADSWRDRDLLNGRYALWGVMLPAIGRKQKHRGLCEPPCCHV